MFTVMHKISQILVNILENVKLSIQINSIRYKN